ncbi:MAG: YdiU family protein [Chromatiaceae bacterium]|nr:YdiU family protein [Chromatiaceae bacterium]
MLFDNSYTQLPQRFYTRLRPSPVSAPGLIRVNRELARHLGIDPEWLESSEGVEVIAGNRIPEGADPIATVYAGYQFGGWVPQLGDGRAILLGEMIGSDGLRYDIQLKGSGRTPYSRNGDGRAPLGPVLREYMVSEAMAALDIPSSRALAAVTSGESVLREEVQPGGVLVRVAQSHIRIGTFQFFAARQDVDALRLLADHVIQRHYPDSSQADNPYLTLLQQVIARQAQLIASWQLVGFIHGVMNTDNMLLSGETIDYGPCAFMDAFEPAAVFSYIDRNGRYAYQNQPAIAHWNLAGLAEALLPLLSGDHSSAVALAQESIDAFPELFEQAYLLGMRRKLGISSCAPADATLIQELLSLMAQEATDFTLTFRRLAELAGGKEEVKSNVSELFQLPASFDPWLKRWYQRLAEEPQDSEQRQAEMLASNPLFIPRNHLVEEAIAAAVSQQNFGPFHTLVEVLADPYTYRPRLKHFAAPPRPDQRVRFTFCGT